MFETRSQDCPRPELVSCWSWDLQASCLEAIFQVPIPKSQSSKWWNSRSSLCIDEEHCRNGWPHNLNLYLWKETNPVYFAQEISWRVVIQNPCDLQPFSTRDMTGYSSKTFMYLPDLNLTSLQMTSSPHSLISLWEKVLPEGHVSSLLARPGL